MADEDPERPLAVLAASTTLRNTPSSAKVKKRKKSKAQEQPTIHAQHTLRNPPWTYLHIALLIIPAVPSNPPTEPLDAVTALSYLRSALSQFLGLTGTAIPIDIMKIEGRDVWVRVPREDGSAVVAGVGAWLREERERSVGWRVVGRSEWLGGLAHGDGKGLFED